MLFVQRPPRGRTQPRYPQKERMRSAQQRQPKNTMVNANSVANSNVSHLSSSVMDIRSPVIDFAAARIRSDEARNRNDTSLPRRDSAPGIPVYQKAGTVSERKPISKQSALHKSHSSPLVFRSRGAPYATRLRTSQDSRTRAANAATPNRPRVRNLCIAANSHNSSQRPEWNTSTIGPAWSSRTKLESYLRKGIPINGFKGIPKKNSPLRRGNLSTYAPNERSTNMPRERSKILSRKVPPFESKPHSQSFRLAPHCLDSPKGEIFKRAEPRKEERTLRAPSPQRPPPPNYPPPSKPEMQAESKMCVEIRPGAKQMAHAPQSLDFHRQFFDDLICHDDMYGKVLSQIRAAYEDALHMHQRGLTSLQNVKDNEELHEESRLLRLREAKTQQNKELVSKHVEETEAVIRADRQVLREMLDSVTANLYDSAYAAPEPVHRVDEGKKRHYANGNAYADVNYPSQRKVHVRPPPGVQIKKLQTTLAEFEELEFQSLPRPTPRQVERPACVPPLRLDEVHGSQSMASGSSYDTVRVSELMASTELDSSDCD